MVQSGALGGFFLDQRDRAAAVVGGRRFVSGDETEIAVFLAALGGLLAGGVGGKKAGDGLVAVQGRTGRRGGGPAQGRQDQLIGFVGHNPPPWV